MGGEAEDIMSSFAFAEATDAMKYDVVKAKFDKHFVAKKNVIYERAKFNQRVQGPDEPVENFITTCTEEIYILDDLDRPLLGRNACHKLGIIKKIDEVRSLESNPYVKKSHSKLFKGLGCIPGEYNIELKDDTTRQ